MMTGRVAAFLVVLGLGLTGCTGTIGVYHSIEGGEIAQARQAPPGSGAPYPNLAAVPEAPVALNPGQQTVVGRRLAGHGEGVSAASPEALAGLSLPGAPPPTPDVPDIVIPQSPVQAALAPPVVTPVTPKATPPSAPVALAFAPGTALLNPDAAVALRGVAAASGGGTLLVGGFGEGGAQDAAALTLALARAERLADALTADGVPAAAIKLVAMAGGSGGFVQLFY